MITFSGDADLPFMDFDHFDVSTFVESLRNRRPAEREPQHVDSEEEETRSTRAPAYVAPMIRFIWDEYQKLFSLLERSLRHPIGVGTPVSSRSPDRRDNAFMHDVHCRNC